MVQTKQRIGLLLALITLCATYLVQAQTPLQVQPLCPADTVATATPEADDALPKVFTLRAPQSISDLREIEAHIRHILPKLEAATVHVAIGSVNGSGVVISEEGLVLTASHVSGRPGRTARITFPNGRSVRAETLGNLPFEPPNDLADIGLIRISEPGEYPFAELGSSGTVEKLDWCFALGHPGGLNPDRGPVLRIGRVWANRDLLSDRMGSFIATDCVLLGGDSGGPLFDVHGRVIGINSRIAPANTNNMHAPVDAYYLYQKELVGGVEFRFRGFFGLDTQTVEGGVKVVKLIPGFPAEKAGLRFDDRITSIEGTQIRNRSQCNQVIQRFNPGQIVKVHAMRGSEVKIFEISVGDFDEYDKDKDALNKAAAEYRKAMTGEENAAEGATEKEEVEPESNEEGNPDGQ